MIRISDIAISVDIDDSVSQCLQIIDCLESQLETIKWFHIVILTEIAYKSSPESHEKLFYLLFFPGQDNMNMVIRVNVKSRLIKLVLLPLWYGNKDIIRDTLS